MIVLEGNWSYSYKHKTPKGNREKVFYHQLFVRLIFDPNSWALNTLAHGINLNFHFLLGAHYIHYYHFDYPAAVMWCLCCVGFHTASCWTLILWWKKNHHIVDFILWRKKNHIGTSADPLVAVRVVHRKASTHCRVCRSLDSKGQWAGPLDLYGKERRSRPPRVS